MPMTIQQTRPSPARHADGFRLALPDPSQSYEQDQEWFLLDRDGTWEEIRFHDYGRIYSVPGLYERLFYEILECGSPRKVRQLLDAELTRAGADPAALRALDLGAGNGIMGQELRALGVRRVVGVDILPEAAEAARRDRPDTYDHYLVADMSRLPAPQRELLAGLELNLLTSVAALGFGDIPPEAFRAAYNLVADGGWVAFTLKDSFYTEGDVSGYHAMLRRATAEGVLELTAEERYPHRRATNREQLLYTALVGRKRGDIPERLLS